ncbi:MAG TPA: diaminopimelate epimerase [Pyrinomonadaceae bacterium]|nr:diaminopimelate epimerase [Pyrinomonadaceae bacterium]
MSPLKFTKFHGFGNDYIVLEKNDLPVSTDLSALAMHICDRYKGAGSDGIAVLERLAADDADFFCEIINPDGSVAGFSGNGTRCAVAYLHFNNIWDEPGLRLKTRSGIKNYHLIEATTAGHFRFEAEIGVPAFAASDIPFASGGLQVIDSEVRFGGDTFLVSCVNVGNPVACIFVDDFDLDWRKAGRGLEVHEMFPERANIVFVRVIDAENIEIRIWERGAGETSASGTCSSGAAVLSAFTGRTGRRVNVLSEGGVTSVDWRDDGEILLTGDADLVYRGEWPTEISS